MRVVFIGSGAIGLPTLRWLLQSKEHHLAGVVTQPDKPAGRRQEMEAPPIKAALGPEPPLPLLQPARIKHPDAVEAIRQLRPEVLVVMAYGQILPRAVLELPSLACLNLHASLLPRHRGAAPIQAAIAAGESETGITVMYMDEGLDTGDILLHSRVPIARTETGGSLHDRLGEIAPAALHAALRELQTGNAPRVAQDAAAATYAPKLERAHGKIDWNQPAEVIERKTRAFDPWPGSYTLLADPSGRVQKLKIFRLLIEERTTSPPGEIRLHQESFSVSACDRWLRLDDIQLEGRKRMPAAEFVRGHPQLAQARVASLP